MWNCMNVILVLLPISSAGADLATMTINDFWTLTCSCLYTAADDLLDMLFLTEPMEVIFLILFSVAPINQV